MIHKNILATVALLMALHINAQEAERENKHEISFRVGSLFGITDTDWNNGNTEHFSPILKLEYLYSLNKTWSVGGGISYVNCRNQEEIHYYDMVEDHGSYWIRHYEHHKYYEHLVALTASVKAKWCRHRTWNMYSRASVGPALLKTNNSMENRIVRPAITAQLSPIGFEIGSKRLRANLELGFGLEGIVTGGISYNF